MYVNGLLFSLEDYRLILNAPKNDEVSLNLVKKTEVRLDK